MLKKTVYVSVLLILISVSASASQKKIAYLVSDIRIPFWSIMAKGIKDKGEELGYEVVIFSANNDKKSELQNTIKAIKSQVSGIIVSPISSSTCSTMLRLAKNANVPVVIADVGTDSGEYVSFISSDNYKGAYDLGNTLVKHFKNKNIKNGSVGIVAIPQKRKNGQLRTQGFLKALKENNYKAGGLLEQIDFSCDETYRLTEELLSKNKSIKAIWLQGSDRYKAALRAINDLELKKDVSLITFDAEPEFLELIPKGVLIASGMQQPFLMGTKAIESLDKHLKGKKVQKIKQLDVLTVSTDNIKNNITNIQRNVFGIK